MNISLLISATMRYSAPILLAAVGALFCDCAGVTFIILEAQMLLACFFCGHCRLLFPQLGDRGAVCGYCNPYPGVLLYLDYHENESH